MYLRHAIVNLMDMLLLGSAGILQNVYFTMQIYSIDMMHEKILRLNSTNI